MIKPQNYELFYFVFTFQMGLAWRAQRNGCAPFRAPACAFRRVVVESLPGERWGGRRPGPHKRVPAVEESTCPNGLQNQTPGGNIP